MMTKAYEGQRFPVQKTENIGAVTTGDASLNPACNFSPAIISTKDHRCDQAGFPPHKTQLRRRRKSIALLLFFLHGETCIFSLVEKLLISCTDHPQTLTKVGENKLIH